MAALHPRPLIPFLVASAGIAFFCLMDAAMKDLSLSIGAYNAVLWRNMMGAAAVGLWFVVTRQAWPSHANLRLHLWRSAVVAAMAICFFWAIARLPLAEAIGLSFIAPVIALYLAALLLGEAISREAIIASLAGFAGMTIILAGRLAGDYNAGALLGVIAVLISAVLYAYNLILARHQAQRAGPLEIAFFQNLFTAAILSLFAYWFIEPLPLAKLPMVSAAAFLAVVSVLLLSWAYARAEAQILIPVEYTGFVWAVIFGWLFFDESVTWPTLAGTALIITGSLFAARAKPTPVALAE